MVLQPSQSQGISKSMIHRGGSLSASINTVIKKQKRKIHGPIKPIHVPVHNHVPPRLHVRRLLEMERGVREGSAGERLREREGGGNETLTLGHVYIYSII